MMKASSAPIVSVPAAGATGLFGASDSTAPLQKPLMTDKTRLGFQILLVIVALYVSKVTLSALGILQMLLPFLFGFIFACISIPPALYILYKRVFEAKPGSDRDQLLILPQGELAAQLSKYPFPGEKLRLPKTLEERINEESELKSVTWGDLHVQFQGKKSDRVLCYCVLKGESFFFQNTKAKGRAGEIKSMLLTNSYVRMVDETSPEGYKHAIEVIQPDRCLLFKVDYIYLIANDDKNCQRWYYALRSICKPWEEVHTNLPLLQNNPSVKNFEKIYSEFLGMNKMNQVESGHFLQIFVARLWIVLRESPEIKYKLLDLLQVKLSLALEDLGGYLSDVAIKTIDLGSTIPRLQGVTIKSPPDVKSTADPLHTLVVELGVAYTEGTVKIAFGTKVSFGPASTEVTVTLHVKQLHGKLMIIVPPYPNGRLALSFSDDPVLEIDIDLGIGKTGGSLSALPNKVQKFIYNKIRGALKEGFVWPNREYINLPFLPNNDPARPVTKMEVKNEAVSLEQLGIGIAGNISIPLSPRGKKEENNGKDKDKESKEDRAMLSPRRRATSSAPEYKNASVTSDNAHLENPLNSSALPLSPRRGTGVPTINPASAVSHAPSPQNISLDGVLYSPRRGAFVNVDDILTDDGEVKTSRRMDDLKKEHLRDSKDKEKDREKAEKKERERVEKERKEMEKKERERLEKEKKEMKKKEKEDEKERLKMRPSKDKDQPASDSDESGEDSSVEKDQRKKLMEKIAKTKKGLKNSSEAEARAIKMYNESVTLALSEGKPIPSHLEGPDFDDTDEKPKEGIARFISKMRKKSKAVNPGSTNRVTKDEYNSAPLAHNNEKVSAHSHTLSEPVLHFKKVAEESELTSSSSTKSLVSPRSRPSVPTLNLALTGAPKPPLKPSDAEKPIIPTISLATTSVIPTISLAATSVADLSAKDEVQKANSKGHRQSRSFDNRDKASKSDSSLETSGERVKKRDSKVVKEKDKKKKERSLESSEISDVEKSEK